MGKREVGDRWGLVLTIILLYSEIQVVSLRRLHHECPTSFLSIQNRASDHHDSDVKTLVGWSLGQHIFRSTSRHITPISTPIARPILPTFPQPTDSAVLLSLSLPKTKTRLLSFTILTCSKSFQIDLARSSTHSELKSQTLFPANSGLLKENPSRLYL